MFQWNSNAGDLLSPTPALCIGISPPSGNAVVVTDSAGRAGTLPLPPPGPPGPPGPFAPAGPPGGGPCAITIAQDDTATIAESKLRCKIFIRIFLLISFSKTQP